MVRTIKASTARRIPCEPSGFEHSSPMPTRSASTPKRRKPARRACPTEQQEQEALARWLNSRRLRWLHVPNGGARNVVTGAMLKRAGLSRGAPDVLVFSKPPGCKGAVGSAIELKRQSGGRVSPEQAEWLTALRDLGWCAFVAKGAVDAIRQLHLLGY